MEKEVEISHFLPLWRWLEATAHKCKLLHREKLSNFCVQVYYLNSSNAAKTESNKAFYEQLHFTGS